MDKDKLVKLLRMTTSSQDGEALNAIRMANAMLKAAGLDWDRLVNSAPASPASDSVPWQTARPYRGGFAPMKEAPVITPLGNAPNKFPGYCYCCGDHVVAGDGVIFKPIRYCPIAPSNWMIACDDCNMSVTRVQANPAPRR
jgi:hypothetical protein